MSKMGDLEVTLRGLVAEVAEAPDLYKWWERLPDGAVYRRDADFVGWATFTCEWTGTYFVDLWSDLCYGPVSAGIADVVLGFLIQVQTDGALYEIHES